MRLGTGLSLTSILRSANVPGALRGLIQGGGVVRGSLTNSLKGSVSAGAVLAGGLSLKRALVGNIPGGANIAGSMVGGYDVILLVGQSNMSGYGTPLDGAIDVGNSRIQQYAQAGPSINTVIQADEPLRHNDSAAYANGGIGHALAFAKQYAASISTVRKVLLVPCALGSTGFSDPQWSPGSTLFAAAVTAANAAMTQGTGVNRFVGILWHQGENDAAANWTSARYAFYLDRMVAGFRAQITGATNSWFVLGQMVPEWIASHASNYGPIDAAHSNTPLRLSNAAFWTGNTGTGNIIHYDAVRQRLNGVSAYNALASLSGSPSLPGQVTALAVGSTTSSSATLTWTAPASGPLPTDYLIEYRLSGGTWGTFTHGSAIEAPTATVSGLTASTAYDFRVSAISTPGTGAASSSVTASTGSASSPLLWNAADVSPLGAVTNSGHNFGYGSGATGFMSVRANQSKSSGKWYVEQKLPIASSGGCQTGFGFGKSDFSLTSYLGSSATSAMVWMPGAGTFTSSGLTPANVTGANAYSGNAAAGDIYQFAFDFDAGKVWLGKNGVWSSGDPATGTSPWITWTPGGSWFPAATMNYNATDAAANEVIQLLATTSYAAPTGFTTWNN